MTGDKGGGTNRNIRGYIKRLLGRKMIRITRMEKTSEEVNCFLCVPSEWKLRSLGKEVHGKSKDWGHMQSHITQIGNRLT